MPISSSKIQTLTNSVKDTYVYPRTLSSAVIFENGNSYGGSANETLNTTLSRAVFLNTTQTITGAKTFSLDTTFEGHLLPGTTNSKNLGSSSKRWSKLYLGTQDTYGSSTQPIYWNNGVPAPTQLTISDIGTAGIDYMVPCKVTLTDNQIYGYYYNSNFYKDSNHTILITPNTNKVYIDLSIGDLSYWYTYNGSSYSVVSPHPSITYSADKTLSLILAAINNGQYVYIAYETYVGTNTNIDYYFYRYYDLKDGFALFLYDYGRAYSMLFCTDANVWSFNHLQLPSLDLYDKILANLISSRVSLISMMAGDTLYLTPDHKNVCLLLLSFGNTIGTEFQTGSDFNIDDELEIVSGKMTTVLIREDDTNGIFIYNNGNHGDWQLTPGYGVASLKLMSVEPSSAGSSYDYDYEWMIKGDVSLI